ncbi:hypothetical protein SAMN05216188_11884 [Lentzea xinjiangensis]|uniref:Uncharacterized protein n=1 Tax=Lentzea xinjiangensis TaxID=402600 RepID=A0A1H9TFD2_9PSEU|nr:hypothetical protein [Lentzea xinjiangensis]SER95806.1 hypothetical protein SAMN05216188_11884 [Lentzea xinjiangensis]
MRIRSIKPEFYRSDDIAGLSREHRLLFIALWSYVDDNGVGIDSDRAIAADCFGLEDDPVETREFVRDGLATLSRALLVARYEVAGKRYIHITGWDRHQRVDRPNKPRYPRPPADLPPPPADETPDQDTWEPPAEPPDEEDPATPSRHPRDTPSTGTEEQGNRGTEAGRSAPPRERAPARPRERVTPAELNTTASRPDAYRLVASWADTLSTPVLKPQQRELAKHVTTLLSQGAQLPILRDALDLWAVEGRSPNYLPHAYTEAARAARAEANGGHSTRDVRGSRAHSPARSARGEKVRGWLSLTQPTTEEPSGWAPRMIEGGTRDAG